MFARIRVQVYEEIAVDPSGRGRCSRRYDFFNDGDSPQRLPALMTVPLHASAEVASVYIKDGDALAYAEEDSAYEKTLAINTANTSVPSRGHAAIIVIYDWEGFLPSAEIQYHLTRIALWHDFSIHYELAVSAQDPGLLESPAVRIVPSDLATRPIYQITSSLGVAVRTIFIPAKTRAEVHISVRAGGVPSLPLLKALAIELAGEPSLSNIVVIFIQHLLNDFEGVLESFVSLGLVRDNAFIVGIPYSTKDDVVERLSSQFENVEAPTNYQFYIDDVRNVLIGAYELCGRLNTKFLVVEDGGYVATLLRDDPDGELWAERCIGIVEQTRNGIRVSQAWESAAEEYDNRSISIPVVNVADTELKAKQESPLIGEAVVLNIKSLLRCYEEWHLDGASALLVGCGSIGVEIAKVLVREGCKLTVVEERPREEIVGLPDNVDFRSFSEIDDCIKGKSLIIGATGRGLGYPEKDSRPPLDKEKHYFDMDDGVVLVNASSKLCEFNWDAARNMAPGTTVKRGFGHEMIKENGHRIRVAADGFPINFYNSESAPAAKMQPILGMLFFGAIRLLREGYSAGVIEFTAEDQAHIEDVYGRITDAGGSS